MWLLPTRDRLSDLRRFLDAAREMGTFSGGFVLVNRSEWAARQAEYEALIPLFPNAGWSFLPVEATSYGEAICAAWPKVKDDPWIGLVSDDHVPCSANWDKSLIDVLTGWNVVYSDDGWQAPARMHGAIVWSGDLARTVGWVFPDGLRHIFHDDVWETLGRETGCATYRGDVMVRHLHAALGGESGPTMDHNSDLWKHDEAWFTNWKTAEMPEVVRRIRALMEQRGVKMITPDYSGVSLMIGTPAIDGRYESHYVVSLFNTFDMLRQRGVSCQLAEEKYTADISLARSKIFAAFLRSACSHLLMIDADMGWGLDAVNRLFFAKKDMVAIAGPKKRYPLSFAANYTDAAGNPVPMTLDGESGTMEVGEIGMAFCLVTRTCAERMIKAHPELCYRGVTSDPEWAVFNPMVANDRYYSEDFAFCRRWRDIGGHVHMIPDIALKHTGNHTFEGKFLKTLYEAGAGRAEAAE